MSKIDIVIADDHPVVRGGLKMVLEEQEDLRVVAEAEDGEAALTLIQRHKPDIAIVDIAMPKVNGLEVTRQVSASFPGTRVIVLTMLKESGYLSKVMEAGAYGYLLKDAPSDEIVTAIHRVLDGERYFSQSAYDLIGRLDTTVVASEKQEMIERLTPREKEILILVAEGYNTQEIAQKLFLSPRTVDTHRANIMHKLGVHNAVAMVRVAIECNLVSGESRSD